MLVSSGERLIIAWFMFYDIRTQKKNGLEDFANEYQIQHHQDPTNSAISIIEWMNRLKLIVNHSHLDQRVYIISGVDKCFEVG